MAHALGKQMGALGRSVSCIFGQLLASAEIEDVSGLPCWALDLESRGGWGWWWLMSDNVMRKTCLVSCTLSATFFDRWKACQHGILRSYV